MSGFLGYMIGKHYAETGDLRPILLVVGVLIVIIFILLDQLGFFY